MKKLYRAIAEESIKIIPNEACGFVRGDEIIPVKNISPTPETSFVISAKDYLANNNNTIYHSHPVGTHGFSEHDLCVANSLFLISYVYVVESDRLEKYIPRQGITIYENILKP